MNPGKNHIKSFILFPVLFSVLGFFILFLAFVPFLKSASSVTGLFFLSTNNVQDRPLKNIFTEPPKENLDAVKLSEITYPQYGTRFGQLFISSASVEADLYFGDGSESLNNGVGIYNGSFIPGYGKTILIAGHNHTYFHTLGNAKVGDMINIDTSYGKYGYKITKTQIKQASDASAYNLASSQENLILYTCYPFDCIGLTPQRYYVYAEYESGPKIDKQG